MLNLLPIGNIDEALLKHLSDFLKDTFKTKVMVLENTPLQPSAYNSSRKQYHSSKILREINTSGMKGKILCVTDVDLYVPRLNFVFGEADPLRGVAIISLVRLKQEFYNLKKEPSIFIERTIKEAVHELGHLYGLGHCTDPKCVMYFSNSIKDTDFKGKKFCNVCNIGLHELQKKI
ncbi:MAG: archaemetzincin family Zn-dependent metalloprotease [Nitrospirae bacterium]|nr:archaemetzincin family Zn-dependent metalloprotease [Nitrospirota bacterium]